MPEAVAEAVAWRRRRVPSAAGPDHGGARRAAIPGPAAPASRFLRGRGAGQPGVGQLRGRAAGRPGLSAAAGGRGGGQAAAARPAPPRVGAVPPHPRRHLFRERLVVPTCAGLKSLSLLLQPLPLGRPTGSFRGPPVLGLPGTAGAPAATFPSFPAPSSHRIP